MNRGVKIVKEEERDVWDRRTQKKKKMRSQIYRELEKRGSDFRPSDQNKSVAKKCDPWQKKN